MNDLFNNVRDFLENWGIWTLLILVLAKFVTGVLVALVKNEFKWFYIGNVFKNDMLKITTFAVVLGVAKFTGLPEFDNDYTRGGLGAILAADLIAGVLKNVAHIFPAVADVVPSSVREPSRLRLGNPKNLP